MYIRRAVFAATLLAVAPLAPAHAQFGGSEATAAREGFVLPAGQLNILVFRPSVSVGAQTTGGMNEPNVEWTEAAKAQLVAALAKEQAARGTTLVAVPELEGEQGRLVADYSALFRTVAETAFQHKMFPGNRLPTKKKEFDWTLGKDAAQLRALGGDYGLFFFTYDSYGSTGRKVAQILGAVMGFGLMSSGVHIGYAGLVDLKTGDLVWLNVDTAMGGDVRTADGAQKRIRQLLEEFPRKADGSAAIAVPGMTVPDGSLPSDRTGEVIVAPGPDNSGEPKDKAKEPQS